MMKKMITQMVHICSSVVAILTSKQAIFVQSQMLLERVIVLRVKTAIFAFKILILSCRPSSFAVKHSQVLFESAGGIRNKLTRRLFTWKLTKSMFVDHVRYHWSSLSRCGKITFSDRTVNFLLTNRLPMKSFPLLVEKVPMIFWQSKFFRDFLEWLWNYFLFRLCVSCYFLRTFRRLGLDAYFFPFWWLYDIEAKSCLFW